MYRTNNGFTLIELLVVIAIIGILSAVVLASLNDARGSAQDAAIKQMIQQMVAQAELYAIQAGPNNFGPLRRQHAGVDGVGVTRTCDEADYNSISPYGAEFDAICEKIFELLPPGNASYFTSLYQERQNSSSGYANSNNGYAFYVRLHSGLWYCVNSHGTKVEGNWTEVITNGNCRQVTLN